ncbi:hypothetical protein K1719_034879 [Acacia pycnantha]|nr:hypothetical protein K1719_034879 [Acacia pycnantha]
MYDRYRNLPKNLVHRAYTLLGIGLACISDHSRTGRNYRPEEALPGTENANFVRAKLDSYLRNRAAPWKGDADKLKPCWLKPFEDDVEQTKGFVIFSLTNGPEYHIFQIWEKDNPGGSGILGGNMTIVEGNDVNVAYRPVNGVVPNLEGEGISHDNDLVSSGQGGEMTQCVNEVVNIKEVKKHDKNVVTGGISCLVETHVSPMKNGGIKKRGRPVGSGKAKVGGN